jgi:catechol 2,3-dioxygenase-like lactoylglutathione lyase family enzyme
MFRSQLTIDIAKEAGMVRIEHLAIRSRNPEKLAQYYGGVFGWARTYTSPNGGVHLTDGHVNIAVLPNNGSPSGLHHIGVKVEDLDEIDHRLAGFGEQLPPRENKRLAEMRLTDLDGNQIDLSVRGFMEVRPAPSVA